MKFRLKFRPKFFWKRSFFDQNQQPLKSIEPFERILRALFMSQCPYKFFSFLDLRNAFNRFRVFSRDTDCFNSFFWDLHAFRLKVLEKNVGGEEGKVGLSISRTNADPQWNPVYNAFHQLFVVETKRFFGSSVNVILVWQTCHQRSSRAAKSKRRAVGKYFSEWIRYMFLMSKCKGHWNLGSCPTSVLAKRELLRNVKCWLFLKVKHVFFRKSPFRSGSLFGCLSILMLLTPLAEVTP